MRPRLNLLIATVVFALCLGRGAVGWAGEDATYPIWWSPELGLESLDRIDKPFEKRFGPNQDSWMRVYKGDPPDEEEAFVDNCASQDKLDVDGYYPRTLSEMKTFQLYFEQCDTMHRLRDATPSKESYVKNFVFDATSLDHLPAMMNPVGSCDFACRQHVANERRISWKRFAVLEFIDVRIVHDYRMVVTTTGTRADLEIFARADFNKDGVEDLLVRMIGGATHGTWGTIEFYVLTRDKPHGVLWVLDADKYLCWPEHYQPCRTDYDYPEALRQTD